MSQRFDRVPEFPEAGLADDEAAREYGRQLAMDLVLQQLYGQEQADAARGAEAKTRAFPWLTLAVPLAAVLVVFCGVQLWTALDSEAPERHRKPPSTRWAVEAVGEAEFVVLEPYRVRLESGEIRVPAAPVPVTVELAHGTVTATGAEFRIGTEIASVDQPFAVGESRVTRIRVASGVVTFETDAGAVVGRAGEQLEFEDGETPKNLGVPEEKSQ